MQPENKATDTLAQEHSNEFLKGGAYWAGATPLVLCCVFGLRSVYVHIDLLLASSPGSLSSTHVQVPLSSLLSWMWVNYSILAESRVCSNTLCTGGSLHHCSPLVYTIPILSLIFLHLYTIRRTESACMCMFTEISPSVGWVDDGISKFLGAGWCNAHRETTTSELLPSALAQGII